MPAPGFWPIAVMYSLFAYFLGHQASHLAAITVRRAELRPRLALVLLVYRWVFFPWLFLIWYGYKTVWWYAVAAGVTGFAFRLIWTKIEMVTGAVRNAWAISLIGIPIVPVLLILMLKLTLWSTETNSLLERCLRCPV